MESVNELLKRLKIKVSLGLSVHNGTVTVFAHNRKQAERWIEKLEADGCSVNARFGQGAYVLYFSKDGLTA